MAKNKRDWAAINARKGKPYNGPKVQTSRSAAAGMDAGGERRTSENIVVGRNPVMEALRSGREIEKILIAKGAEGSIAKIVGMARDKGIPLYQSDKTAWIGFPPEDSTRESSLTPALITTALWKTFTQRQRMRENRRWWCFWIIWRTPTIWVRLCVLQSVPGPTVSLFPSAIPAD